MRVEKKAAFCGFGWVIGFTWHSLAPARRARLRNGERLSQGRTHPPKGGHRGWLILGTEGQPHQPDAGPVVPSLRLTNINNMFMLHG